MTVTNGVLPLEVVCGAVRQRSAAKWIQEGTGLLETRSRRVQVKPASVKIKPREMLPQDAAHFLDGLRPLMHAVIGPHDQLRSHTFEM